eukprot:CAMPEP_0201866438 /NCGR_PEP_ID=MMETSP0902-20130614/1032_1 /ASSEMBLY_ACC=CAM_ASM_000551 /TAXON_ID=420261 /ORGANISM="Thalassiosira antarctica, Strain CCMP982" /LENGTH=544 /DNA_ID=CAMNT_0048391417 /DNA_START=110 /DNA_END=1744 /DNA_ORIENTATION=-
MPYLLASLLLLLLLCTYQHPVSAGVFGRKADKEADKEGSASEDNTVPDAEAEAVTENTAKSAPAKPEPTAKTEPTKTKTEPTTNNTSKPTRPPAIIEAEARTARELSHAVGKLTKDLKTCNVRVDAIEEGFQNLYSAHLGNVDGLRKCKEGVLTTDELDTLHANLDKVNPALVEQAQAKEDEKKRSRRNEELASKHRVLIHSLEDQVESLVRRERSWERTISELVARRDLLERREGAWERTIGDLMGEIEIRAKRENWWEEMKVEMEGRIGALSQIAVVERFGPGPHFVSMHILLEEGNPSSQRELIFQLAPLSLMPHSIHLFLSQIAEGYWSHGTPAIVLNAQHVLQACPHPCLDNVDLGGTNKGYPYNDMKRAGLDVVSFQEYSPRFPHEKYTIGFAGRPHSGPEFYINLMDNTLDHGTLDERKKRMGPTKYAAWAKEVFGGAEEVAKSEKGMEPYPCFGKLVKGFDTVDDIAEGMTRASLPKEESEEGEEGEEEPELDENMLLRPVKIASVSILENYSIEASAGEGQEKEKGGGSTTNDEL